MTKEQYEEFVNDLITGEKTEFKEWEKNNICYFEGCLPIEVMADRGVETLRYGPLKPVGLTNPHVAQKSYAVVQLRQDNKLGTLYNIVGFQTKLKYGEQARIFKKIPGLENADFARFGGIHRNSFINSPKLLDESLRLKLRPNIRFAGQVTGVEGYVESAAMGLLAGIFAAYEILGKEIKAPAATTAIGSLVNHITVGHLEGEEAQSFQPMNVNFGLFERLEVKTKKGDRKEAYSKRALSDLKDWIVTLRSE
jgi:methylenetetrahydrofolate--tRNA-(uracil-5-)-methyltransferase